MKIQFKKYKVIFDNYIEQIKLLDKRKLVAACIGGLVVFSFLLSLVFSGSKNKSEFKEQLQIHPDKFFSTTPRVQNRERIIIVYRNGQAIETIEYLDNKGKVVNRKERILTDTDRIYRGNEVLRNGEQLQNGDVISDRIMSDGNNYYKEKEVLQNNKIKTIKEPLDDNGNVYRISEKDLQNGIEIASRTEIINGKKYTIKDILIDGKVVKRVYDENGNLVEESTVLHEEVVGDKRNNSLKRVIKIVKNGDIINVDRKVRDIEDRDEFGLDKLKGLFKFKKNHKTGLTNKDEIKIQKLKNKRSENSGALEFVGLSNDEKRNYKIYNQDVDYSAHREPKTTATYPVNLSRTITEDKNIPVVLITEIKSSIPSRKVLAQVEQDIYASHGRKILIPKGSKAIGSYEQLSDQMARRIAVLWHRIITPQGINIKLEGELIDQLGAMGITGHIDRRVADKYGAAFLMSVINAAGQMSVPMDSEEKRAAMDALTREFSGVTTNLLQKGLNTMPIITIPQGTRIYISPLQDIWFKEPQNKEVKVLTYNNK